MLKVLSVAAAAALIGTVSFEAQAAADDVFAIEVILEDLANVTDAEEFEKRLNRAARDFCEDEAPYLSRARRRQCERDIIDAVIAELEEQDVVVAWSY